MSEKVIENNKVSVIGEIISGFTFSHEVFGEGSGKCGGEPSERTG